MVIIFSNTLYIKTSKGQIEFTSFMSRNLAYDQMVKVLQPQQQPAEVV